MGQCQNAQGSVVLPTDMAVTGKKRALLVGINYVGSSAELNGCINDIVNQKRVLMEHFGFQEKEIRLISEDEDKSQWPYKRNIVQGFRWLYDGAQEGDLLFFQYSGHGSQYNTTWNVAECICPLDCLDQPWPDSVILDTEINEHFFGGLPAGCKAVALFDCCHSGTVANLPVYRGVRAEHQPKARYLEPPSHVTVEATMVDKARAGIRKAVVSGNYRGHQLWVFSGCQDHQTSADAFCDGSYQGAFTWAFIKALKQDVWNSTYFDLLSQVRHNLRGYTQVPALSTTQGPFLEFWYLGQVPASAGSVVHDEDARVGQRRALLVGINYRGTSCELRGCINDVEKQRRALKRHFGFKDSEILVLTEDEARQNWPTKRRILEGLSWLVTDAKAGDQLFLHYSGHGSQMTDVTGREPSGLSDCICPLDCNKPWPQHIILDTEIHTYVYDRLPAGAMLTCIFDCCHSGTVANLPIYRDIMGPAAVEAVPMAPELYRKGRWMQPPAAVAAPAVATHPLPLGLTGETPPAQAPTGGLGKAVSSKAYADKSVWVYSGCQDYQTSADAWEDDMYQGAFTWAYLNALQSNRHSTKHSSLIRTIRSNLARNYQQVPALSTTKTAYFDRYFLAKRHP